MTELEQKIDMEVGNATEHERVQYLTFINLGKQLKEEQLKNAGEPVFSDSAVKEMIKTEVVNVIALVQAVLADARDAAAVIEADEDKRMAELEAKVADGPIKAAMVEAFKNILTDVDARHTAVIRERDLAITEIAEKYA